MVFSKLKTLLRQAPERTVDGHRSGLGRPSFSEHFSPSGVMQRRLLLTLEAIMNGLIYLIGLIVVVLFILSFLGLR